MASSPAELQENEQKKRRLRNFLIDPSLQLKMGIYSVSLSVAMATLVCLAIYYHFNSFVLILLELTGAESEVMEIFMDYLDDLGWTLGLILGAFILTNIFLFIFWTHQMIGPSVAFKSHLQALLRRDFRHRTKLRKGDAFFEIADSLNKVSELYQSILASEAADSEPSTPEKSKQSPN